MINSTTLPMLAVPPEAFVEPAQASLGAVRRYSGRGEARSFWLSGKSDPTAHLSEALQFALSSGTDDKQVQAPQSVIDLAVALGYPQPLERRHWAKLRAETRLLLMDLSSTSMLLLPATTPWLGGVAVDFETPRRRPLVLATERALKNNEGMLIYGARLALSIIMATDWHAISDFDIDELGELHQELYRQGRAREVDAKPVRPFFTMLRALEEVAGASVSRDLRHQYMMWRESEAFPSCSFKDFRVDSRNFFGMRVHGRKQERVETPRLIAIRKDKQDTRDQIRRQSREAPEYINTLNSIATSGAGDAPERYFEMLHGSRSTGFRKEGWLNKPPPYPGREHIDVCALGRLWLPTMRAWLKHRSTKFETDKEQQQVLHILADYLFLYLPWWCEQNPDAKLTLPTAPRQFLRYLFVSRTVFHGAGPDEAAKLPRTLVELLALRRPTVDGRNTVLGHWQRFFQFVITAFEDNDQVAGKGMINPIRLDFDRVRSARRTKTDKIPFREDVYPYLVLFSQAVEAFGEFLQQRAYEDDVFQARPYGKSGGFDTELWGYVPIVTYRGRVYPVRWLPHLYPVAKRTLLSNPPGDAGLYVGGHRINVGQNRLLTLNLPHLSVPRMLLAMVETGLRGQAIQWLDRRRWNCHDRPKQPLSELHTSMPREMFTKLLVNTDKTKDSEWTTFVSWRVRRSLLAEQYFQESLTDPNSNVEIDYEGRKNSRFGRLVPLFRSVQTSFPFSDNAYTGRWVEFLIGFERFYNGRGGSEQSDRDSLRLVTFEPSYDTNGSPERKVQNRERVDAPYCPLKYSAIHTPHACRATYATLKDGDLEVSEIAMQLGHSNEVVTNHYQVPSEDRVRAKLEDIERRTFTEAYDVHGKSPAYVQPGNPNSAVRLAFDNDRKTTIAQFGFVPGVALWSTNDLDSGDQDSIDLLRESPSSVIRWHPTHVCPVGNQCPSDVVVRTGGYQRCGLCPLAVKCVDHLPAIAAKKNELKERIRMAAKRIDSQVERGALQSTLDALHRNMEGDAKELMGWELSSEILHDKLKQLEHLDQAQGSYHVDQPEIVRRHLRLVTRNDSESAFFLQRIADSNAYPMLESPEVRARAAKYARILLARAGRVDDAALLDLEPYSELDAFASLIKPFTEAKGLKVSDLAAVLDTSAGLSKEISVNPEPRLLTGINDGRAQGNG